MTPADRLERATWNLFWIPPESVVVDRPELLAIATADRGAQLNAVYRTRAEAARLPALIDEVGTLHAAGRGSRWQVVDTVETAPLERALAAAGYQPAHTHDARVVEVDRFVPRAGAGFEIRSVTDRETLRDSFRVSDAVFGADGREVDEDRELAMLVDPDNPAMYFVAYDGDEPVSAGGLNLYRDLGIALLWGGATMPAARGRGAYSAVVAARIAAAAARRIPLVGLYARVASSSPIVEAQGFERCGRMTFWFR